MQELEYRKLTRDGICICCGKHIEKNTKKVFRFWSHVSGVYYATLCTECIQEMNNKILERKNLKRQKNFGTDKFVCKIIQTRQILTHCKEKYYTNTMIYKIFVSIEISIKNNTLGLILRHLKY